MRWIGLVGMTLIISAGVIFSKNRKAINIRTVTWGLILQILFAIIILQPSTFSWIGMFVFTTLILFYLFHDRIVTTKIRLQSAGRMLTVITLAGLTTILSFWLDLIGFASYFLLLFFLSFLICSLLKRPAVVRYLFAGTMQLALGMAIQRGISGKAIIALLGNVVEKVLRLSELGSIFLFGNIANPEYSGQFGFQFAFAVLPTIIFFSALISLTYYYGLMQKIVETMAKFMHWTMGTSGAETLSCSAEIFLGNTESPLLIRPFLNELTISELHAIMVGGFGTIAGGVMAGYIRMGISATNLIAASVMSAPASLLLAKLFIPETEHPKSAGYVSLPVLERADSLLDALARGVTDGLKLAVNVGAMLLAFIALIGLIDVILAFGDRLIDGKLLSSTVKHANGEFRGIFPGSLRTLLGTLFAPLAFLMGITWKEAPLVGNLIGLKISANEFVAYVELAKHISANDLSIKSQTIATYALCGFANFGSIGIQIGGIGALAPKRRADISRIALRAMIVGALVSCLTATIAGLML